MSWPIVKLGDVVTIKGGGTPDKSVPAYWDGDIPWASVKDFKSYELSRTVDYITIEGVNASATQVIPAGNIIVPTRMAVGKVAINTVDIAINQDLKAIFVSRHIDREFLLHALLAKAEILQNQATGATVKGIKVEVLKNLEIPLPPLEEQKRIAGILDQADALRRLCALALEKLNTLGQAVFLEMFGEAKHLEYSLLGDISTVVRGSSPRPQGDSRYFGGPVPRLMIADITRDGMSVTPKIDSLTLEGAKKSRPMPSGSVVMAVSGAAGLPAILAVDACIHDGFVGFRDLDKNILPRFLYQYLLSNQALNKSKGTGAIWTNLTTDQVKGFKIPIPNIAYQEDYIRKVQILDSKSETIDFACKKSEELFASIQTAAFQGRL